MQTQKCNKPKYLTIDEESSLVRSIKEELKQTNGQKKEFLTSAPNELAALIF